MHKQHGRQPFTQHLQITNPLDTLRLTLTRALHRTRQRRKEHGCVLAMLLYEFVQDEVLGAAGEIVEGEGDGLVDGEAGSGGRGTGGCREG
jgi:hypothetical protein